MRELRNYIHQSLCDLVKDLRINAGFVPEAKLNGYTFSELEDHAEKVPVCDLVPILERIDDGRLKHWWFKFQMDVYNIKTKGALQ